MLQSLKVSKWRFANSQDILIISVHLAKSVTPSSIATINPLRKPLESYEIWLDLVSKCIFCFLCFNFNEKSKLWIVNPHTLHTYIYIYAFVWMCIIFWSSQRLISGFDWLISMVFSLSFGLGGIFSFSVLSKVKSYEWVPEMFMKWNDRWKIVNVKLSEIFEFLFSSSFASRFCFFQGKPKMQQTHRDQKLTQG